MSQYKRSFVYATNFEGDNVTMRLQGMKRRHLQMLSKYIHQDAEGGISVTFENQLEAFDVFADILPECVTEFKGLTDFDLKKPIPLEVVLEDMYFINLVSEIIQQIMSASTMKSKEVKQLKKSQGGQQRVLRSRVEMKA
jgi:hypothetical protein